MEHASAANIGLYDSLYVSPHGHDALVSCTGRLLSERAQGLRTLVAFVVASGVGASPEVQEALARVGADVLQLRVPEAGERSGRYRSFSDAAFGHDPEDAEFQSLLADRVRDLAVRTAARRVYVPLGVHPHADHRLAHEASLQATAELLGRDVLLYEERPSAFVRGSVRARLGEMGARLPPGAEVKDRASLPRMLWDFEWAPHVRSEMTGMGERVRCARLLARRNRATREWNPLRAYGPRLQPVLAPLKPSGLERLMGALEPLGGQLKRLFGSRERAVAQSRRYAQRLGAADHTERYWLVLPPREEIVTHAAALDELDRPF
jgi:LmbE family N-acetylglucosaminyl deacetylase